ncbi:hypothetical protein [Paenibacillus sp. TY11]|uniref:hypothetical protein n=1 Tax=Paenibacillus sp. TY11 TaxID=3448633 RepID=UPI00403A55F8
MHSKQNGSCIAKLQDRLSISSYLVNPPHIFRIPKELNDLADQPFTEELRSMQGTLEELLQNQS